MSLASAIFGTGALKTYDPLKVSLIVGVAPITGFATGTPITAKRHEDTFRTVHGINGAVGRKRMFNKSGEISFRLMQTSRSNGILTTLLLADEFTGSGVVPLAIYESDSMSLVLSAMGWFRKPPEVQYGVDVSEREWVFEAADIDILAMGTASDNS